jgi:hypothetical protein
MHKKKHHEEHKLTHKEEVKGGHDSHMHKKEHAKTAIKAKVASHTHHKMKGK